MESHPMPSGEFGAAVKHALARAGTVTLPWPPPASGPLYIGISPDSVEDSTSDAPAYFLRVVQTVSSSQIITRIVGLDELRAVSLPGKAVAGKAVPRIFQTVDEIAPEIEDAKTSLNQAATVKPGAYEQLLFPDAVIYVREAAPVFVRVQYEFGATASDAAENVERLVEGVEKCCVPHKAP